MERNSLTQNLMDEVYSKWNTEECRSMKRLEVIEEFFTLLHRVAVQFGNMNYQVNNGGWSQWHGNGYDEDLEDLIEYAKKGTAQGIKYFDALLQILIDIESLGEPSDYDNTEDCECSNCGGTGYINFYDEDEEIEEECPECCGDGTWEEETKGEEEYCSLLSEFDDKYYDFNEEELIESFNEFLNRFNEEVNISDIKIVSTKKPRCKLVGTDSNVFSVIVKVRSVLSDAGLREQAQEFSNKAMKQHSYDDVLSLCFEYVEVC
jgi:hypothetical protein